MLINDNGNEITEQQQILNEIRRFYQDLYRSRNHLLEDADLNEIFADFEIPKLTEEDKRRLDADIKKSEVLEVLKQCKKNKSPGSDGFTAEFLNTNYL